MQHPVLTVYGHPRCPMLVPIRQVLNHAGVSYTYINIHTDAEARTRVQEMNAGNETVPTLVFGDGMIVREPSVWQLRTKLAEDGIHIPSFTAFSIQHSLELVLVGCLLLGVAGGRVLGSAVLGGGTGFITGFLVNTIRMRHAGR